MNWAEWNRRRHFARRLRAAAHATPELSTEYDRVLQARARPLWQRLLIWIGLPLGALAILIGPIGFFNALLVSGAYAMGGPDSVLVTVSFYQLCWTVLGGTGILANLRRSPTMWMPVASVLPVSDRRIASGALLRLAGLFSILTCFTLSGVPFVAFAERVGPFGWFLALTVGLAQCLLAAALAILLAVYWPTFPGAALGIYGIMAGLLFFPLYYYCGAPGLPIVADVVYSALPVGWPNAIYARAYLQGAMWAWWGLLPTALVIAAGFAALPRLIGGYRIREFQFISGIPALADSEYWSKRVQSIDFRILRKALAPLKGTRLKDPAAGVLLSADELAAAAESVRMRFRWLARADDAGGSVVDRWQQRLLTRRERDVLSYMIADWQSWNRFYPKVLAVNVAGTALAYFVRPMLPANGTFSLILIVQVLAIAFMYLRGERWLGFAAPQFGGACISRYALLPVGFDEISWLMLKIACFRGMLILPLLASIFWATSLSMGRQPHWLAGVVVALTIGFLYVVGHGWIIAGRFAETTSGVTAGHGRWYWNIVRIAVSAPGSVAVLIAAFFSSTIALGLLSDFGFLPDAAVAFGLLAQVLLFSLSSLLAWLSMRAMYRWGIVDLVRTRPSLGQQMLQPMEQAWYAAHLSARTSSPPARA